jgi:hypothetical protein
MTRAVRYRKILQTSPWFLKLIFKGLKNYLSLSVSCEYSDSVDKLQYVIFSSSLKQ